MDDLAQQVSEDFAQQAKEAVARVRAYPTANFADAAVILTTSLHRLYAMARESDSICGLPVIHVGRKNLRLPSAGLLALVGLSQADPEGTDADES